MPRTSNTIVSRLGFSEDMDAKPKYHANNNTLDVLNIVQKEATIADARTLPSAPGLDVEGFALVRHPSKVTDFRNAEEVARIYNAEIRQLLIDQTGADDVVIAGMGILRFGERSGDSGALNNSRPARFVHIDNSDETAAGFYDRSRPAPDRPVRRSAQYNVWRVLTSPPQDVPLAVCDARSVGPDDLMLADAIFDKDGEVLFSFESYLVRQNPDQRWYYFSDMSPDEALIFKTNDTDPARAHNVPHGAFDNPLCPADAPPRASIEMRGIAYWYE